MKAGGADIPFVAGVIVVVVVVVVVVAGAPPFPP